jgi:hypothetical protein
MLVIGLVVAVGVGSALASKAVSNSGAEDVYMEPASAVGTHPFTTAALEPAEQNAAPPDTTVPPEGDGPTTTALYGGSGSQRRCDPAALIAFLETHPDKTAAWVGALDADPTLRWSANDGIIRTKLTVADIRTYITDELTPTFLRVDTRVTNHGYFNGHATPHQSILQAGTAVLVDRQGVPRARCACGNPLIPPHRVRHPHYKGPCWPGCRQGPQCAGGGCGDTTTTEESTTTSEAITTTSQPEESTTTTRICVSTNAGGCGPLPTTHQQSHKELPPPPPPVAPPPPPPAAPPPPSTTRPTRPPTTTTTPQRPTTTTEYCYNKCD